MAGVPTGSGTYGEIVVARVDEGLIEWRGLGALRREHMIAAHAETEAILDTSPEAFDWLCDGFAIESFEGGMPMLGVRWCLPRIHRFRRTAIVGRTGPMLSVASTFHYLLPGLPIGLFTDRTRALVFLDREAPVRVRRAARR